MTTLFSSHTAGWLTLAALLAFSPQLAGCDTTAPSKKDAATSAAVKSADSKTVAKPRDQAEGKTPNADAMKEVAKKEDGGEAEGEPGADAASANAEAAPAEAPLVKRLVIASDIEEREPVELASAKVNEPIVAFVELNNKHDTESDIVVTFEHESGKKVGYVELTVPPKSPRFRTWGRTRNIKDAGEWTAIVSTKSGEELARKSFTVAG